GAIPAAQPVQALLFLVEFGERQLALRDLIGQLGLVLAAVGQELAPLSLALRGEERLQLGSAGLILGHRQHHGLAAGRRDGPGGRTPPAAPPPARGPARAPRPRPGAPPPPTPRHTATRWRDGSAGSR